MKFLYFLEDLRVSFIDELMLLITQLGEETAFLVIALIIFWCVDKYIGYFILSVGFIGTIINQFLKLWFRIPRPWVIDKDFTIIERAREAATGYSFPSGHTQSAVGAFGALAYTTKYRWLRCAAVCIAILVPFSRLYIGVHTPLDVFTSAAIAVLLIVLLRPIVLSKNHSGLPFLLGIMVLIGCAFLSFVLLYPFPDDIDLHNLESGLEAAYTLIGALGGLLIVYIVDEKWLKFPTKAPIWAQFLKVIFGFIFVVSIKSGLKSPLNAMLGNEIGRSVRYCLVVIAAGIIWPLTFSFFSKLGTQKNNEVTNNE